MNDTRNNQDRPEVQAQPAAPERFNAYRDDTDISVSIGQRLAKVMDTSPFLLWSEQEAGEIGGDFYMLAADMAQSERARRLAVEFAQAVAGGMPERTRLLIMAEWAAVVLRELPDAPERTVLAQAVETALVVAAMPAPASTPAVDAAIANIGSTDIAGTGPLRTLAEWTKHAIERLVEPPCAAPRAAAGYEAWYRAADMLGSIAQAVGTRAEEAFVECERVIGGHIYRWR